MSLKSSTLASHMVSCHPYGKLLECCQFSKVVNMKKQQTTDQLVFDVYYLKSLIHVHNYLYNFLTVHKLLHLAQSDVRKIHSCETALAKMVSKWASNINKGNLTGIVLLDLHKAFDLVDQVTGLSSCSNPI